MNMRWKKIWLGIIDTKNAKHEKRVKKRINACTMASKKVVEMVHTRRWKKKERQNRYSLIKINIK